MALDAISDYMARWREQRERAREFFEERGLEATRRYLDEAKAHWVRLACAVAFSSPPAATYRGAQDAMAVFAEREQTAMAR